MQLYTFEGFVKTYIRTSQWTKVCEDPDESGPPPPHTPEKSQNKGFLSNACPDPLKNHKSAKPEFNVGPSSAYQ